MSHPKVFSESRSRINCGQFSRTKSSFFPPLGRIRIPNERVAVELDVTEWGLSARKAVAWNPTNLNKLRSANVLFYIATFVG